MSIAPVSAFPPTGEKQTRPAATTAPASNPTTNTSNEGSRRDHASRADRTDNKITFDDAGFTVVKTIDVSTGDVLSQNPTEAYLRLAHAMIDIVRSDAPDRVGTDIIA